MSFLDSGPRPAHRTVYINGRRMRPEPIEPGSIFAHGRYRKNGARDPVRVELSRLIARANRSGPDGIRGR